MADRLTAQQKELLDSIPEKRTVLIAGPTASGKSALALALAQTAGGVVVNADASQVYDCWRVLTARPSQEEEALAPHALYGHVSAQQSYSTGHWLREVEALLGGSERLIITGGTGLYFTALTRGLADIPPIPANVREQADNLDLDTLRSGIDAQTQAGIDMANRARVQRAWEVQAATGKSLRAWQDDTGAPLVPMADATGIVLDAPKEWLTPRIEKRFGLMLEHGALQEAADVLPDYDPSLPAHRAIGAPELMAHLRSEMTLDDARAAAIIATRQFAKRQRTWFRSKMRDWAWLRPE